MSTVPDNSLAHLGGIAPLPWRAESAISYPPARVAVVDNDGNTIARCAAWSGGGEVDPRSMDIARLMAVAPDLFAVVQGFRRKLSTYVGVYPGDSELRRLLADCDNAIERVAIAAAEGRS